MRLRREPSKVTYLILNTTYGRVNIHILCLTYQTDRPSNGHFSSKFVTAVTFLLAEIESHREQDAAERT
jgi:hypothetical protein